MGTCGNTPLMGGRRKKTGRKTRKMRGGAVLPGFGGTIGTAGAIHTGTSLAGAVNSSTGAPIADPTAPQAGGRRLSMKAMKRLLKKNGLKVSGRKSTLTKRMKKARLMRGGAASYLPATANAGFSGAGSRGMADFSDVSGSAPTPNGVVPLA